MSRTQVQRGQNWIDGEANPFNLAGPPSFFLDDLWAFDPELVLFPSQEEAVYRLARRVRNHSPLYTFLKHRPDTKVFVKYRLVPVTSLLPSPFTNWGPVIFQDLAAHDIYRNGGARRVADKLDEFDADAEAKAQRQTADDLDDIAGFAYRSLKWRQGETIDLGGRPTEGAHTSKASAQRARAYRPMHFDNTDDRRSSAVFVGR